MILIRFRRAHLRAVVAATVLAIAAFGAGNALADHDDAIIHACASNSNGSLRLVSSSSECRSNERAVDWRRESAIPLPQSCPAGQFVTGITAGGQLTCATPGTGSGGGGDGGGGGGGELRCTDGDGDQQLEMPPPLPNATGQCDLGTGAVTLKSCNTNYWDLNGVLADGCEYGPVPFTGSEVCDGTDNDADGSVDEGVVLPPAPNATSQCHGGVVTIFCDSGFDDANGDLTDGCEVDVNPTVSSSSEPRQGSPPA